MDDQPFRDTPLSLPTQHLFSHLSFRFRIVRNRASENCRGSSKDSGSVGDPGSPHGSPNGGDALQRGGTYSISGILGISPQGTSPLTDHNGNTGTKRKLDETSKLSILRLYGIYSECIVPFIS